MKLLIVAGIIVYIWLVVEVITAPEPKGCIERAIHLHETKGTIHYDI